MQNLIRERSTLKATPKIHFCADTGVCEMEGSSFMEVPTQFYLPIMQWLIDYMDTHKAPIYLEIRINYFNTSSSRQLLNILLLCKHYIENDGEASIKWYIDVDDIDLEEEIEDYIAETGVKIFIIKEKNHFGDFIYQNNR